MESINEIFNWLSEREAGFSALAALVVIIGVTLSPLGVGMRGLLSRRKTNDSAMPGTDIALPTTSSAPHLESSPRQDFLDNPPPLITDKPSVAVLPFVNMSDDKDKEYFADGMTEDIITGLSCDSRLFVIARNSTFAYKDQSPDIRTVGKELGVRYVLEGSIRPINDRLRITVQLIETNSGTHVWADKIDRPLADIFDVQDEVVDGLVTTLCANLSVAEGQRLRRQPPGNLKAWELLVRAETMWVQQISPNALPEVKALCLQAREVDPDYAPNIAFLAYIESMHMVMLLIENVPEQCKRVHKLAERALELAPEDSLILGYIGWSYNFSGKNSEAIHYMERSLALNPNSGLFRHVYGTVLLFGSRYEEALVQFELFFRQSPKDPSVGRAYFLRALALIMLDKFAEAEQSACLAVNHQPNLPWTYVTHGIALAGLRQYDAAHQAVRRAKEVAAHFELNKMEEFWRLNFVNQQDAERLVEFTRKAWPE